MGPKNYSYGKPYNTKVKVLSDVEEKALQDLSKIIGDDIMDNIYKKSKKYIYSDYEDIDISDWQTAVTNKQTASVSKTAYDSALRSKAVAEEKSAVLENVLDEVLKGNIEVQRAIIKVNPHHIQFIKNPYVEIQLEAIMADSTSFHKILNPSQEAVDAYGFVQ